MTSLHHQVLSCVLDCGRPPALNLIDSLALCMRLPSALLLVRKLHRWLRAVPLVAPRGCGPLWPKSLFLRATAVLPRGRTNVVERRLRRLPSAQRARRLRGRTARAPPAHHLRAGGAGGSGPCPPPLPPAPPPMSLGPRLCSHQPPPSLLSSPLPPFASPPTPAILPCCLFVWVPFPKPQPSPPPPPHLLLPLPPLPPFLMGSRKCAGWNLRLEDALLVAGPPKTSYRTAARSSCSPRCAPRGG